MSISRQRYRSFAEQEPSLPLFHQPWWLDAACGEAGWDVALVEQSGVVLASLPYQRISSRGLMMVTQPPLTMFLGPWLSPGKGKRANELGRQKDLMSDLIDKLPPHDYFRQSFGPALQNWLPFYWRGFEQTTRYTYVIDDLSNMQAVWDGLRDNIRTDIRKATQRHELQVDSEAGLETFMVLVDKTYARQGKRKGFPDGLVASLESACAKQGCHRILIARDPSGRAHAGAFIVWDRHSAYYLIGGGDPELRNSGATSLCLWEAIKAASAVTQRFDFEGSMMEPVERFFRAFGARQMPYFSVSRATSWKARLALAARSLVAP